MTRVPIKESLKKLNDVHKKIITDAAVRNLTKGQTMADTLIDTRFKKLTNTRTYPKNTQKDRAFSMSWKSLVDFWIMSTTVAMFINDISVLNK
ncbi:hypothetical protein CDAR_451531 [Caerostris darwini]|uniref:Uncharacterized protein n=1 Tax=Caerostris darwini TaxID=1538125 RepID=A0AAV4UJA7_9ARAC|nr:hypothetical protein CDAR_451531 [Caerostris darwini]